jgi:hypothetical protein
VDETERATEDGGMTWLEFERAFLRQLEMCNDVARRRNLPELSKVEAASLYRQSIAAWNPSDVKEPVA